MRNISSNKSTTLTKWPVMRGCLTLMSTLLLYACAGQETKPQLETTDSTAPSAPEFVEDRPFPTDTLYSLLVAEMAGDRRRFDIMLGNYVQQAQATQDPGVAARATRLARYLKAHNVALEMSLLWLEKEPHNTEAHYIATAELIHAKRLLEALEHSTYLLQQSELTGFDTIAMRAQHGGDIETTNTLIQRYNELLVDYPKHMPLHLGLSLLYQHAGELGLALKHSQTAIKLDPEGFQAAAQETRILQQMGKTDLALAKLGQLVDRYSDNPRLRLQYARILLKTDLSAAQDQFQVLLSQNPQDKDIELTLALIKYERGLLDQAKPHFESLVSSPQHQSASSYYLGKIYLVKNQPSLAEEFLSQVQPGPDFLPALSELADLMITQDRPDEALVLVQNKRKSEGMPLEYIEGLYLLESHLFSRQGQTQPAIELLAQAIEKHPESTRLLYSRAMLFTQLEQLDEAEQDFKRVLAITPEHAAALNAWGYTLANRAERLDEAYQYISKAYQLTPDDPAVIDSMGWIEYRMGNTKKALSILRRAMDAMPDHEIAAHLGEVLWVTGDKDEARNVWKQGLKNKPDSEVIKRTMIRLNAISRDNAF